jgi:NAD-dependent SIR2 family protein deacetylase
VSIDSLAPRPAGSDRETVGASLARALDAATELLGGRRIAVLTGAGVSTDSGIPDYRGAGAPVRTPMTITQFLADPLAQKRYWAGSHLGWKRFSAAEPNAAHAALAELEAAGVVTGVVTQNVDGLHLRAGSRRVVDIHGSVDRVRCLDCGQAFARDDIAHRMTVDNPWLEVDGEVELNPDGDVTVESVERMALPVCSVCGGRLKPEVVFFGEFVPTEKFDEARAIVRSSDALLVAGSSLVVNSGIRLLDLAVKRRMPVVIVNRGVTKGDARASLKLDAGAAEILTGLRDRLV